MTKIKTTLSTDSPAYRLFVEELDRHLTDALRYLTSAGLTVSVDQARVLSASFHTIRGSAGFFGLTEIAGAAQRLEDHLMEVSNGGALDARNAGEWIASFSELAKTLPRG